MPNAFSEYYRPPEDLPRFRGPRGGGDQPDSFGFDPQAARRGPDGVWQLPFDPDDAVHALRCESYLTQSARPGPSRGVRRLYYALRPVLPVYVRRHAQRLALRDWRSITFPRWPLDTSVDDLMESCMTLCLEDAVGGTLPFVWFWPEGFNACLIMTHDVETTAGRDYCERLMDLDAAHGISASFQVVPEKRYPVPTSYRERIVDRGFELNVHGLCHDGRLFDDADEFRARARRINQYAREWGARGFRAPLMHRRPEWLDALGAFDFDMSMPNAAHLEAQRGGCCTVFPYFLGDLVELPLTTTQDYTLIHVLRRSTGEIWKGQIDSIVERHGLVSLIVHPDYVQAEPGRSLLDWLHDHLEERCVRSRIWVARPGEVADWWRQRAKMRLVERDGAFVIEGDGAERARIAHARLEDGRVRYDVTGCAR